MTIASVTLLFTDLVNASELLQRAGDHNQDETISVDEILVAVNNALRMCPVLPTATPTTPLAPTSGPTPTKTPSPTPGAIGSR